MQACQQHPPPSHATNDHASASTPPPWQSVVPARFRHDKQLVSHDTHTCQYNYKYTFSVEIAPICKVGVEGWGGAVVADSAGEGEGQC